MPATHTVASSVSSAIMMNAGLCVESTFAFTGIHMNQAADATTSTITDAGARPAPSSRSDTLSLNAIPVINPKMNPGSKLKMRDTITSPMANRMPAGNVTSRSCLW